LGTRNRNDSAVPEIRRFVIGKDGQEKSGEVCGEFQFCGFLPLLEKTADLRLIRWGK
jgi:hypothetical protein